MTLHRLDPETIVIRRQGQAAAQERRLRPCPIRAGLSAYLDDISAQDGPEAALHAIEVEAHRRRAVVFANVPKRERARSAAEALFSIPNESSVACEAELRLASRAPKPSRETSGGAR